MKSLALILAISFVLPLLPISAFAVGRFDTENIAAKDYEEDIVYFHETTGSVSCSSGNIDRWQSISGATKTQAQDPTNPDNYVFVLKASGSGYLTKSLSWSSMSEKTDNVIFSFDFLLPSHSEGVGEEAGVKNQTVSFVNAQKTYAEFTYNEEKECYEYSIFDKVGTVSADAWQHISFTFSPGEDGTNHLFLQMFGEGIQNELGEAIDYLIVETNIDFGTLNLGQRANLFSLNIKAAENYGAQLFVDNAKMVKMYDFAPAKVETEIYEGDGFKNFDLEGKITLTLHHELDLSTVDFSHIHISDSLAQPIPFTSVTFAPGGRDTLIFDFAGNKLPAYTDIYICFDETFLDTLGQSMHQAVTKLETKGEKGEIPPAKDPIEVPVDGFVMPDEWNTGYRCAKEELVPFEEKYPEFAGKGGYEITESIARKYNYEFSHFVSNKTIYVMTESPVYLHDFLQDGAAIWNGKSGPYAHSSSLTIAWMEGCNNRTSNFFNNTMNMTLSHCYVHDVMGDHLQAIDNLTIEYCYFRDGGTRSPGAHADVIQFSGNSSFVGQNIKLYGNRFDVPPLLYDHVANACVFFSPEEERTYGFNDVHIVGNWFNGGGYTTYIAPEDHTNTYGRVNQIYYNYNQFGYGHNFKAMSCSYKDENDNNSLAAVNGTYIGNGYVETLHAGSIVLFNGMGEDAVRVFSAADMTGNEAKIMVNFANYMTIARDYRIEVVIENQDGDVIYTQTQNGQIKRYTPVKEYATADNKEPSGVINPENGSMIYQLINMPDLPYDVNEYMVLSNLPADLEGCSISVNVYDLSAEGDICIRSATMGEEMTDFAINTAAAKDRIVEVRFEDADGNLLSVVTLNKGETATAPQAPAREGYAFIGWSASIENVRTNMTVRPVYERRYTVTFLDKDGNVLSSQSIGEGKSATPPAPPVLEGYAFLGWSEATDNIRGEMTVVPLYEKILSANALAFIGAAEKLGKPKAENLLAYRGKLMSCQSAFAKIEPGEEDERISVAYQAFLDAVEEYNQLILAVNQTMQAGAQTSFSTIDGGRNLSVISELLPMY